MQGSEVQELGHLLREARERKGVTLADAQQATKIRLSFLQALEKEDFSVLPPPFYIRGFIKTYAVYLSLEPRSTVQIFDEILENVHTNRLTEQHTPPSADSGGALISLEGLSQAEADQVANSNERLNLRALPPPSSTTLISGQRRSTGYNQVFDDNPVDGFGAGGYTARKPGSLGHNDKYILKSVMLPTAKGAFYMPNFVPTILVVVIILAAALLIYRGVSNQPKDTTQTVADVTATIAAGGYPGPYAITPNPTLSSARATMTAGESGSSVMRPPAFFTPDASVQALDRSPTGGTTAAANGKTPAAANSTAAIGTTPAPAQAAAPAPTTAPAPTATPTPPPSPTPIPDPITAVISIANTDSKGSWIRITVDDKVQVEKVAAPNESFTYTGNKVAVRAGNPGLIKVTVNGEDKEFTTSKGGVITHTWFAGGKDLVE